ncbi:class I SAM-dependent methyltransferase [Rasiella rasia]|uniref:Class I SAM-dependent methyltransferase n=1 Tax=Rasiella rasia TaxID=2744027 RepID=A0A6G6GHK2_9FLAO|nr:class I SAM-dependent methyltransferase [Rasiella rasia]QIE58029.1 class I SAM-dependent methyltransferase [Rasiella rasia]
MHCRICGNSKDNTSYQAREMMFGLRETFNYFECSQCKCLQIAEFPEDMSAYYPENYYSFGAYSGDKFLGFKGSIKKKQYQWSALGGATYRNTLGKLIGKKEYAIFKELKVTKDTRILDVGCGNGRNFLYPLAEVGLKNLLGCDPFLANDLKYPNGLEIKKAEIFDIAGTWDIITYHHSFEHLPNPKQHFKKIVELLAPNGVCIIRIPTTSSYAWKHYRENWVQLDAPRHFFLYSEESMEILAQEAALDLYKIEDDATHFQFTGSEKYMKDIPLSAPKQRGFKKSLQRKLTNFKLNRKAKRLNKKGAGDQSAFYFRKK